MESICDGCGDNIEITFLTTTDEGELCPDCYAAFLDNKKPGEVVDYEPNRN